MSEFQDNISNPFRPGAGHMPPYLAGRQAEQEEFASLLGQRPILKNMVVTGLRGVGKTVLLETFRPIARAKNWLWVGTDLSESSSCNEDTIALRLLTDLAVVTSGIVINSTEKHILGFSDKVEHITTKLNFEYLSQLYQATPGLVADKLKTVFEQIWPLIEKENYNGVIFAYDEAQNLEDHSDKEQYPLSVLMDVCQSLQRKHCQYLLVLAGLPTLFPKLVEARTYSERMFQICFLDSLNKQETEAAIHKPLEGYGYKVKFLVDATEEIWRVSHGYPYFIQYICREGFDAWLQGHQIETVIPMNDIIQKLDRDFFYGRWARATDRQHNLLTVISELSNYDAEFTVQEIAEHSEKIINIKPFKSSNINQMLTQLIKLGLIYKNRHGKYSFAVPLLGDFIKRHSGDR